MEDKENKLLMFKKLIVDCDNDWSNIFRGGKWDELTFLYYLYKKYIEIKSEEIPSFEKRVLPQIVVNDSIGNTISLEISNSGGIMVKQFINTGGFSIDLDYFVDLVKMMGIKPFTFYSDDINYFLNDWKSSLSSLHSILKLNSEIHFEKNTLKFTRWSTTMPRDIITKIYFYQFFRDLINCVDTNEVFTIGEIISNIHNQKVKEEVQLKQ